MKQLAAYTVLLTALALPASAAEEHRAGGLPQLDPTYYPSQVFWLVIHFALLYVLMTKLVLPRIKAILDERQGKLAGDLGEAERLQKEAEVAQKAYETSLNGARQKAHALRQETMAAAAAERKAAEDKLATALATRAAAANERIATAMGALHVRLREVASEAVPSIVSKIGGLEADRASVDAAVARVFDGALKEVA